MTGIEIAKQRRKAGMSHVELAELLGVHEVTVWNWEGARSKEVPAVRGATRRVLERFLNRKHPEALKEAMRRGGWMEGWRAMFERGP